MLGFAQTLWIDVPDTKNNDCFWERAIKDWGAGGWGSKAEGRFIFTVQLLVLFPFFFANHVHVFHP